MIQVTSGDIMHMMGGFGLGLDYTVRMKLRLADEIDDDMLKKAVEKTQRRFPYLSLRMRKNDQEYYYEENPTPVTVINTDKRISLNSDQTNYHVWAVCYCEDRLYLDIYRGIADGTGMYMVLSTLLYYYCAQRYGVSDSTGIRTLEDPVLSDESTDPIDSLPQIDVSAVKRPPVVPAFSLVSDAGLTASEHVIYDIEMPEKVFVKFSSAHDASPGTMVSVLFSRAIDVLFPDRDKPLTNSYVVNARPMLGTPLTHHNCVGTVKFEYSDRIKSMPFDRQCTVHRGTTFIQSDADRVRNSLLYTSSMNKSVRMMPGIEAKKQAYAKMLGGGRMLFTYMVSYIGKWKTAQLSPYVKEFWTHVPNANDLLTEIAAINGRIFLSVHQNFTEDIVIKSFLHQLDENSVPYTMKEPVKNDVAFFPEP